MGGGQTLEDVRIEIDALDCALVTLLCRRQACMAVAARIKVRRDDVYDPERIEDVISKVRAQARTHGLSEKIAEPVWRTLIARSIAYEFDCWDRLRAQDGDGKDIV